MKSISKYTLILLLLFSTISFAQLENANWYFGDGAGLNFNGSVGILNDGETENLQFHTASVSDNNGNLLFYTDGLSVWNKNHVKMSNGINSLNGIGNTVAIVPHPGTENKYYVFTIRVNAFGQDDGYFYSIVNFENNSLGAVESLNTSLSILPYENWDPANFFYKSDIERLNNMAVAKHSDGESYWLLLNPFDHFFALKIDANGIDTNNPIISDEFNNGDPAHFTYGGNYAGRSGMSISPNMEKVAYYTRSTSNQCYYLKVYNFNNTTGVFSYDFFGNCILTLGAGLDTEFSSNSQFLYLLNDGGGNFLLEQLDVQNINNSPTHIGNTNSPLSPSINPTLSRGIDGKIYLPSNTNNKLGVINNPNNSGLNCNYVIEQIDLANGLAGVLPKLTPFHDSISDCEINLIISDNVNSGDTDIQEAARSIIALNIIDDEANAEYDAVKFVKLTNGFHAKSGSTFRAYIEGCSNTPFKFSNYQKESILMDDSKVIKLYPNPTNGKVIIESTKAILQWELISQLGSVVNKKKLNTFKKAELNLSNLPTGLYFIKITLSSGEQIIKRVIKN